MFKDSFKRLVKEIEEAPSFSELETKKQAQVWDWNIAPMFKAWSDIASEMKNKKLREVIDYTKIMKEVKE